MVVSRGANNSVVSRELAAVVSRGKWARAWALVQWSRALGPPGCSHIGIILTPGQPYRGYSYPGPALP